MLLGEKQIDLQSVPTQFCKRFPLTSNSTPLYYPVKYLLARNHCISHLFHFYLCRSWSREKVFFWHWSPLGARGSVTQLLSIKKTRERQIDVLDSITGTSAISGGHLCDPISRRVSVMFSGEAPRKQLEKLVEWRIEGGPEWCLRQVFESIFGFV